MKTRLTNVTLVAVAVVHAPEFDVIALAAGRGEGPVELVEPFSADAVINGRHIVVEDSLLEAILLASIGYEPASIFATDDYGRHHGIADRTTLARFVGHRPKHISPEVNGCNVDRSTARELCEKIDRMRAIYEHTLADRTFPAMEHAAIRHLVQMNVRGIAIDTGKLKAEVQRARATRDASIESVARRGLDTSKLRSASFFDHLPHDLNAAIAADAAREADRYRDAAAMLQQLDKFARQREGRVIGGLHYGGTHSGRFTSGGEQTQGLNLHGLPRRGEERSLLVPDAGRHFVAADLSAIELRVLAWLAEESELIDRLRGGEDVYATFAAALFDKSTAMITDTERNIGKIAMLGLGFGMGRDKLATQIVEAGGTRDVADAAYDLFHQQFPSISELGGRLYDAFVASLSTPEPIVVGKFIFDREPAAFGGPTVRVTLPTGRGLHYRNVDVGGKVAMYSPTIPGTERRKIHRGRLVQNVTTAIARDVLVAQVLEAEGAGLGVAFHVHDEIIASVAACTCVGNCIDACTCVEASRRLQQIMSRVPSSLPGLADLPLAAKIKTKVHLTYA